MRPRQLSTIILIIGCCLAGCGQPPVERMRELGERARATVDSAAMEELLAMATGEAGIRGYRAQSIATLRIAAEKHPNEYHARVVAVLVRLLDDEDWAVRREAALAVGAFGAQAEIAVPALLRRMELDKGRDVELFAAESLGLIGRQPELVVPALMKLVPSRRSDGRPQWGRGPELVAIGRFGPAAQMAIPALEVALADDESEYALRAAEAMAKVDPTNQRLEQVLVEHFRTGTERDRFFVLFAIKEIAATKRSLAMVALVSAALKDSHRETRKLAAELSAP